MTEAIRKALKVLDNHLVVTAQGDRRYGTDNAWTELAAILKRDEELEAQADEHDETIRTSNISFHGRRNEL